MWKHLMLGLMCTVSLLCARPVVVDAQSAAKDQAGADATPKDFSFKLNDVNGKVFDLASMRGEVVMVSFGATWCAPCVWELAAIEELKQEYQGKPVRFLWVSVEGEKETSNALLRHYAKSNRLTIPVLRDPLKETFAKFSERVRLPLVVFFDQHGQYVPPGHRGMASEPSVYKQAMRRRLDALLNTTLPPPAKQAVLPTTRAQSKLAVQSSSHFRE